MGYLDPSEFDPTKPADTDSVRFGAMWLRDTKARLQRFAQTLFNLETGTFRDSVIDQTALKDLVPSPTGTWRKVTVNSRGLVTSGENPNTNQAAQYYRAVFQNTGTFAIERPADSTHLTPWVQTTNIAGQPPVSLVTSAQPAASPPFSETYSGAGDPTYWAYSFKVPSGVTRIKATIIGGGGGGQLSSSGGGNWYGGGGAELMEVIFSGLATDGSAALSLYVGGGGADGYKGCPSRVAYGSTYAEVAPGLGATASAGGGTSSGHRNGSLAAIQSLGATGGLNRTGKSGSTYLQYGIGGGGVDGNVVVPGSSGFPGSPGLILLEWVA